MIASPTATLQYYVPQVHNILANTVMSAFLLGLLTILSVVSVGNLFRRGVKQPSTAFMLGSVLILYASTAMHFGFALAHAIGYARLLDSSVTALSSMSSATVQTSSVEFGHSARTTAYIVSLILAVNVTLGDAIVWWRVCVLWRQKSVIILGLVLTTSTLGFGIASTVHWPSVQTDVDIQPLMSYGDIYGGVSGILSLVTNVTATFLIGYKAWEHRGILRQGPGVSKGRLRWNTPSMKVLALLVESGAIYCVILGTALANNLVSRSKDAASTPSGAAFVSVTTVFLSGCFVPLLAIYPTVIIFIIAVERSFIDSTLANVGSPSAIPSGILPSIVFRNSSATINVPLSYRRRGSLADCEVEVGGLGNGLVVTAEEAAQSSHMKLPTFWNRDGEPHQLEPFPASFQHWEPGEPLDQVQQTLLHKLESILGKKVMRTELRAMDRNMVLEVEYNDGHQDILRMPEAASNSNGEIVQDLTLFNGEIALLQWLEANSVAFPISRVLTVVQKSSSEPYTFAVIEKLPGDCILNVFGGAPFDIKESIVRKTARFMLELNNVAVPQRIGTTAIRDGTIDLAPLVHVVPSFNSDRVFDTLEEYMASLVQAKRESDRIGSDDDSRARANKVLDRLIGELPSIFQRLSAPVYRRCILSHDDLNETNVLVNSDGDITGIIDWEYHSVRPVVLAAQYPCYLRYDGVWDPHFGLGEKWWVASPDDAARLRAIYAEVVKSQNEDYWRALVDGELLRQVYEWLTDSFVDPGCAAMARWMDDAFGSEVPGELEVNLKA